MRPFFRFTPVIGNIILLNVLIMLMMMFLPGIQLLFYNALALHSPMAPEFIPTQYLTYMFLHANIGHLFGNMFGLMIFGSLLEDFWGARRIISYYLICGLGAGLIYSIFQYIEHREMYAVMHDFLKNPSPANYSYFMYEYNRGYYTDMLNWIDKFRENPDNYLYIEQAKANIVNYYSNKLSIPMVGASGALFGILMAYGMLFPNTTPFIIPIPAKYIVALYGITAYFGVIKNDPGDFTAHWAHLGGMIIGFFVIKYWQKKRTRFY